jgi:hypothetical protein
MVSGGPRLGQVEPRERAGAQTGRKYEYQYERTARAALDLLRTLGIESASKPATDRQGRDQREARFLC